MPSLFKRSNGIYYIVYNDNGKTKWKSTRQHYKSSAWQVFFDFKNRVQSPSSKVTISQFEKDFLVYAEITYSPKTVDLYKRTLANFKVLIGDVLLTSISPKHIDLFKIERLKDISAISVNIELRTLKAALQTAMRWKLVNSNPCSKVQLISIPDAQPNYFKREDFQKLISIISETWLREIVIFAVLTGLRRGEILNLRWDDVDLNKKIIYIHSNPTFRTKQGKRRVIPLNDVAYHLLNLHRVGSSDEYVFSVNGRLPSESFVSHQFKKYVGIAKLPSELHFHSLRHTFASWLVQDGVSIYEVQKLLGHSNISVTQVYSHLQPEKLHATVNRISIPLN
jgi:integrase